MIRCRCAARLILRLERIHGETENQLVVRPQMFVMRQSIHHLEHGVAGLVLGSVLEMRGRGLQHLLERGRNAARNAGYSAVFTISMPSRTVVTSARRSLGLSFSISFFACASNWLRARGEACGNGAGRTGRQISSCWAGKPCCRSSERASPHRGTPEACARVDLPRMIDAAVLESRAGSTGAYLAFSSVERPPLAGADILPLYCREVSSGEASRATSSDFAVGGATSTEIARRPSDVVRARRGGSRATLKARGVKLALVRRLVDVKALAPRRSPHCLPIRRRSLGSDNLRFDGA